MYARRVGSSRLVAKPGGRAAHMQELPRKRHPARALRNPGSEAFRRRKVRLFVWRKTSTRAGAPRGRLCAAAAANNSLVFVFGFAGSDAATYSFSRLTLTRCVFSARPVAGSVAPPNGVPPPLGHLQAQVSHLPIQVRQAHANRQRQHPHTWTISFVLCTQASSTRSRIATSPPMINAGSPSAFAT